GEALRRLFGALDKPLTHFVPLSIQRSIAILVRRLGNEPDLERVETVVAQIARTPAHAYLRLGALVSALESLRPRPKAELVEAAVEAILHDAHGLLSPRGWAVPVPASRANRAVEVEKVVNVLTHLIDTVSAPAGPDPLKAAKRGICELRREIATILDE